MAFGGYISFGFLLFVIACLGAIVVLQKDKEKAHDIFGFFTLFTVLWLASNFFQNDLRLSEETRALLLRFDFASAVVQAYFFWVFARHFPHPRPGRNRIEVLLFVPVALAAISAFTPQLIARIHFVQGAIAYDSGALYLLYGAFLAGLYALGLLTLGRSFLASSGVERRQTLFVLIGFALSAAIALVINLFLQNSLPVDLFRLGAYGLIFLVAGISYAIIKHHLFDVKIIATEAISFMLVAVLLGQTAFATSSGEFIFRILLFFAGFGLSVMLVKSVIAEVERREQIQKLAEDLKVANTKLEELSEMKTNFISIASHQLRAPIGGVRGYLSMMRDGDFGKFRKKVNDVLDLNLETLGHLLQVIETFLNVTRVESGKISIMKEPTDVCELVTGVHKELAMVAERKHIRLAFTCPKEHLFVSGDREKLRNVIFNYVENALKYTEQGSITTSLTVVKGQVEVRVTDTGIGIDPAEVSSLFAKFVRAGGGFKIAHGSGLGLYVAKTLVEAHGGQVFVESLGVGKGSTFGFRLPALPVKKPKKS